MNEYLIPYDDIQKYEKRIRELHSRSDTGSYQELSESQKFLYKAAHNASTKYPNNAIQRELIENEFYNLVKKTKFDFNSRDNFITDFCYNMVNLEDNLNKFLICPKRGHFKFLDFSWLCPDGISIRWNVQRKFIATIGEYRNGSYNWNFNEVEKLISKSKET